MVFLYRNIESLLSPLPKILVMSRRIFCIRLKISPQIFQKTSNNMTSILLYGDLSFHLNLTPTYSIHLLTIFYPQKRFESPLFTVSWFVIQVFIIFVFQLNKFRSFVVFYPHFIFFLVFSFFQIFYYAWLLSFLRFMCFIFVCIVYI